MEWTVVTVIVVLVGLISVSIKPVTNWYKTTARLDSTITKLDTTLQIFLDRYKEDMCDNDHEHNEIWDKCSEHDDTLSNHEMRIHDLERDKGA